MPEQNSRFAWIILLARVAFACLALCLLIGAVFTGVNAYRLAVSLEGESLWIMLAAHILAMLVELAGAVLAPVACGIVEMLVRNTDALCEMSVRLDRVETLASEAAGNIRSLVDLASLSDKAKSRIFREHEIEALRETIHHNLVLQDYDAANSLIESMEKDFGYAEEAAALRDEMSAARRATQEEKVDNAVKRIQEITDRRDWPRATRESQRLMRLMPDNEKIASLPKRIEAARTAHKRQLLQAYGDSVRKNDVDGSINLLRQLDLYLTAQEAAALQESARGMFRAKLHNLGVQFAICVTDERWSEAVATGEEIIRNFPNSRMATEVREKMDQLRARSGSPVAGK